MASRVYPVFLPATNGPDLVVKRGGVVISSIAPGLDIKRTARLTVPMLDFDSGCEFFIYGKAGTIITNKVSVGLVTEDADLGDYVGADKYGLGYRMAEGQIHHDGVSTDSVSSGTLGTAIGIFFQPDAQQVTFLKNGGPVITKTLPADMQGVPLYLAVSIGSDVEPGDIEVQANPGRYWYEYPVGAEWWEVAPIPTTLRISDEPFISPGTDVPAYVRWEGGITADRIQDDRGVHFWLWGRGDQARGSAAVLDVLDSTGYLDQTLGGVFRDQPASLQLATVDIASAQSLGNYIVDKIESTGPLKRRITLKGPLAQFEVPMLNRQVRPDSDEESVGQFYPMLIGPAFSCPLRLLTKANRMYAVDAMGAEAVGKVRDNGAALDPSSQFTVHAGGQRIEVLNEPAGTITLDAAASGGTYTPPATPDVIAGDGSPFTGTTLPDNWTVLANPAGGNFQITAGRLTLPVPGSSGHVPYGAIKHDTAQLIAGRTYKYSITFNIIHQRSPTVAKIGLAKGFGGNGPVPWLQATGPIIGSRWHDVDGIPYSSFPTTVTGVYTPAVTHDVILYWVDRATPDGFTTTGAVSNIVLYELPPPEDDTEDVVEAAIAALGLPLADMLQQGIETRCRLSSDVWDRSSAETVDTVSGYSGQGFWAHEQIKLRDYIEALLAPYCASVFEAADGRLTVARLVDPETVVAGGSITQSDYLNDPEPRWDDMPGLTCSIGCRKNEHIFSDDEIAGSLAYAARGKLTKQYRYERTYLGPLTPGLEHARAAETLDSRLLIPDEAQDAIDYVGTLAQIPRAFIDLEVVDPGRFEVGDVVALDLPRWFPEGTRNVYITRIQNGRQEVGTITVWCRAPWA